MAIDQARQATTSPGDLYRVYRDVNQQLARHRAALVNPAPCQMAAHRVIVDGLELFQRGYDQVVSACTERRMDYPNVVIIGSRAPTSDQTQQIASVYASAFMTVQRGTQQALAAC